MRTTLELPDDLLRRAKIAAVKQGTTLRELIGRALAQELGVKDAAGPEPVNRVWLASLRDKTAVTEHSMESIRESIAAGRAREQE